MKEPRTSIGRWYWSLEDRQMTWFLITVNSVVWAIGALFMVLLAEAPWLVDLWVPLFPAIAVNLALSAYNLSRLG